MNRFPVPRLVRVLSVASTLVFLASCGGGKDSPPPSATATKLHYVNPPASGFRLEVDPATNDAAHLVLNLMGPSATAATGVAFFLTGEPTAVAWGNPGGADPYAKAGSAFTLGAVPLFKTKLTQGTGDLQVGLFQTGAPTHGLGSASIVSLALDLKTGTGLLAGTRVGLAPTVGKTSKYLDGQGTDQTMTIGVGVLTAQ